MKRNLLLLFVSIIISYNLHAQSAPVLNGNDTSPTYTTGASPLILFPNFTITSSSNIEGMKIYFSSGHHNDQDNLLFTNQNGISGFFVKSTGMLTLTGSASASTYETAIRSITYTNNSSTPNEEQRVMGISVNSSAYNPDNGHYYEYVSTALTWTSAKAAADECSLYGLKGYLATVTSQTENDFIKEKLSADGWLGGTDQAASDVWRWASGPEAGIQFWQGLSNGSTTTYAYWNSGEPNNSGGAEYYLQIYSSGTNPGRWNDLGTSSELGYVVEYGGTSGDPTVNLYTSTTLNVSAITTPFVTTAAASGIGYTYAYLGGTVTSDGGASVSERGIVYSTTDASPTIGEGGVTKDANGNGTGSFGKSINSLSSGATYYYQAYATNSQGTSYGGVRSFTVYTPPVLGTSDATIVASSSASISGSLTTVGNPTPTAHGLVWGTSSNPTTSLGTKTDEGSASSTHSFSRYLEGLEPGTRYYYRSYSTNSLGTTYGEEKSFWTTPMTCYNITASDFVLNNNASLSGDIVTLTPDALSQNGSVWGKMRINLDYDFKVTSSIYLGTDDGGADGIAFVLQPLSSNAGSSGGGMGYQGISPSYAVEFDTYYNGGADPTSNDHIAIVKNGEGSIAAHSPYSARSNLEDGNWHDAIFEWNATTKYFKVTYEGSVLFNVNIDLTSSVFNNNSNVYWGFTAATGGCKNLQRVDISEYCCSRAASTPPTITAFNDVTICPNTPTSAIGFTIADNESEWGQMSVSATSSNQSVIPESNIVFGGSEGSRTITLSPASNQQGYSDITVTVTDADGQTDSEVFTLTVEDVTPPVLSVVNDTVYLNSMGSASITEGELVSSASDNCGIEDTTLNIYTFDCDDADTEVPVTVTLNDVNGLNTQRVSQVLVLDTIHPVVVAASDISTVTSYDGMGNCSTSRAIPDAYYDDNCTVQLTWEMTGAVEASGSGQIGTYVFYKGITTITYTATDASGNWRQDVMEVEVLDDEFPIITPSHDQSIGTSHDIDSDCKAAYNVPFLPFTDNCPDAVLTWEMEGATTGFGKGQIGYYSQGFNLGQTHIYYTVTDESGNESYDDFWLTVTDDEKPRDMGICGSTLDVYLDGNGAVEVDTVSAALNLVKSKVLENCTLGDNLEVNFVSLEYGCGDLLYGEGTYQVQLYVTDEADNILNCQVRINLQDSTRPEVSAINTTLELDENGQASVSAPEVDNGSTDNCTIDSIWLSQERFGCGNLGNNTVTFYAKDLSGNIGQQELTVSVEDNILPTVTGQDLSIWLGEDGTRKVSTLEVDAGSYDNCGIDTMWLSQKSFDSSDLGTATLYLYGEDGSGNISVDTVSISVSDTTTPVVQANNISIYLDGTGSATIDTTDINNGSTDNCGIDTMWLSQSSFGCSDVGVNSVTLYAKDASGNTGSEVALVTVSDTANPVMQAKNIDVFLDGNGEVLVQVSDVDNGSSDNCGLESTWLSRDTFSCSELGLNTIYLYGEDAGKNLDSVSAIINVRDTISPVITINEATLYLNAEGELAVSAEGFNGGVWDNCSVDSVWTDLEGFDCDDLGMREVGLYAKDNSGNITRETASIEVLDTVSPMAASHNLDLYLDSNGGATLTAEQVNNGSFDYCGIDTMFIDKDSFSCENLGTGNYVELTVVDNKGNVSTSMATMTVLDTISPIALCQDIEVYLDSVGSGTIGAAQIDNGSSDNCGFELSLSKRVFGAEELGDNLITMTVSDASGNQSTCESTVTVLDTIAPVVVCNETTFVLWENGEYVVDGTDKQTLLAGTWDNSAGILPMDSISLGAVSFECVDVLNGGSTITVTAGDGQGNIATAVCPVEVVDLIAPTANCIDTVMVTLDGTGSKIVSASDINDGSDTESTPAWARTYNDLEGGSYDACGIAAMEVSQSLFSCADIGFKTVTLTVSDPHRNTGSCESVVHVVDAVAPEFEPVSDIVVELEPGVCTAEVEYPEVIAVDQCGGLSYTLLEGQGPDGVFPIGGGVEKWLVTDKSGNTDTLSFSVLVSTYNAAPVIDPLGTVHIDKDTAQISVALTGIGAGIDCGGQMATIVSARAADTLLLTSTEVVYAPGDSEGELILGIAPGMSGSTMVTVRVQDNGGTDNGGVDTFEESFLVVVDPYNKAPYLVSEIIDYEVVADHELEVGISCRCGDLFDDRDDETLSIKVTLADGSELPSWGHYANDVLTITPTRRDTGCVEILVTATDSDGLSATTSFNVCILNWVTGVATFESPLDVKMYPNPAKGMVNLDITGANTELEVVVMDISGKEVLRKEFMQNNQIRFDMGGQVSGMYFVRVNVDGREIVKKLILDRR